MGIHEYKIVAIDTIKVRAALLSMGSDVALHGMVFFIIDFQDLVLDIGVGVGTVGVPGAYNTGSCECQEEEDQCKSHRSSFRKKSFSCCTTKQFCFLHRSPASPGEPQSATDRRALRI